MKTILLMRFGVPLIVSGMLKAAYDLALWFIFRKVTLSEGSQKRG